MKYLFTFLLILKLAVGAGQTIKYQCLLKTDCTDTITIFKDYLLTKDKRDYRPMDDAICVLTDTGTYYLTPIAESHIAFSATAIPIRLSKQGLTTDTLLSLDLHQFLVVHSGDPNANKYDNWQFCGHLANGYLIDYTMTGRTEGKFRQGRAIGAIKTFNKAGELTFISYYNSKGKLLKNERTPAFYRELAR